MIYHSNLTAPEIHHYFKHVHCRVMAHSFGHHVLSDFMDKAADDPIFGVHKQSGFWTHDEAAILYNVARAIGGHWLDIGGATGWTAAHLAAAGCTVTAVEPMYNISEFRGRAIENLRSAGLLAEVTLWPGKSDDFFTQTQEIFDGVVVDGNHDPPFPPRDARNAAERISDKGVILFHDAIGAPVKAAYRYLVDRGWNVALYRTPHVVAVCYRANFKPPEHSCDPGIPEVVF